MDKKKKKVIRKTKVVEGQEFHEDVEVDDDQEEAIKEGLADTPEAEPEIPGVNVPHPGKCPTCGRDR